MEELNFNGMSDCESYSNEGGGTPPLELQGISVVNLVSEEDRRASDFNSGKHKEADEKGSTGVKESDANAGARTARGPGKSVI